MGPPVSAFWTAKARRSTAKPRAEVNYINELIYMTSPSRYCTLRMSYRTLLRHAREKEQFAVAPTSVHTPFVQRRMHRTTVRTRKLTLKSGMAGKSETSLSYLRSSSNRPTSTIRRRRCFRRNINFARIVLLHVSLRRRQFVGSKRPEQ